MCWFSLFQSGWFFVVHSPDCCDRQTSNCWYFGSRPQEFRRSWHLQLVLPSITDARTGAWKAFRRMWTDSTPTGLSWWSSPGALERPRWLSFHVTLLGFQRITVSRYITVDYYLSVLAPWNANNNLFRSLCSTSTVVSVLGHSQATLRRITSGVKIMICLD